MPRKNWLIAAIVIAIAIVGVCYRVPFSAWVKENRDLAQTYAGLAIAFLTVLLIVITAYYAWATGQTVSLLRKDLEYRTQPVIDIELETEVFSDEDQSGAFVRMKITTAHAPARLLSAQVSYTPQPLLLKQQEPKTFEIPVSGEIVAEGKTRVFEEIYDPDVAESWIAVKALFEDMAGLHRYEQTWSIWGPGAPKIADEREKIKALLTGSHTKGWFDSLVQRISRISFWKGR